MATTVSTDSLVSRLRDIFCATNKAEKKYSEVWLTDEDFGGLYRSNKFVVNVKAEHEIESCNDEIIYIINELFKPLSLEERALIWRVVVYNSFEEIHCSSGELIVYTEQDACGS